MPGNKPWEQTARGRKPSGTQNRRRVLIVCEDSKSSCLYFRAFPIDRQRFEVLPLGTGMNTDKLVEEAVRLKKKASNEGQPFHEIWCVFDRDDFPQANYDRAFHLARKHGLKVAWANEAFELWYLLHFNFHDTGLSRDVYKAKLRPHFAYDKADPQIYDKVKVRQETAIRNARRLEKHWHESAETRPDRQNPSTNVHHLVEFLNELGELGEVV